MCPLDDKHGEPHIIKPKYFQTVARMAKDDYNLHLHAFPTRDGLQIKMEDIHVWIPHEMRQL